MKFNLFKVKKGAEAIIDIIGFVLVIKEKLEKHHEEAHEDIAKTNAKIEELNVKNAKTQEAIALGQAFLGQIGTILDQAKAGNTAGNDTKTEEIVFTKGEN